MHNLGMAISYGACLLEGLLILRGAGIRVFRVFPLFYSYIIYIFCSSLGMYLIYWLRPQLYPSAFWICYLVNIVVEFTVLAEISDQVFRPFPAIRNLGRASTVLIAAGFGLLYILPSLRWSGDRSLALLDFTLRASLTKAIILVVLFYVARRYGSPLGRNVAGLMLGFSIYVAINVAIMAGAQVFGEVLFARVLWVMPPLASVLCLLVWTISLWELVPVQSLRAVLPATGRDSEAVALELNRFNSELSRFLHK